MSNNIKILFIIEFILTLIIGIIFIFTKDLIGIFLIISIFSLEVMLIINEKLIEDYQELINMQRILIDLQQVK